jgi:hypothetical protein
MLDAGRYFFGRRPCREARLILSRRAESSAALSVIVPAGVLGSPAVPVWAGVFAPTPPAPMAAPELALVSAVVGAS